MTWQGSWQIRPRKGHSRYDLARVRASRPGKGLKNHDLARVVANKAWQGPQQIPPGKGQGSRPGKGLNNHDLARVVANKAWQGSGVLSLAKATLTMDLARVVAYTVRQRPLL